LTLLFEPTILVIACSFLLQMASREDIMEAQKRDIEALKQEQKEFRINASYYGSSATLEVPHNVWVGATVLSLLNMLHVDFRRVFFEHFRALLRETNDEAYVCRLADYVRWIRSKYMFVRVERPRGSKHCVLGYVKCDWAFSFALRFEQMRLRLNRIPPMVLTKVEHGENKALRLACVGETDYERALARHHNDYGKPPLMRRWRRRMKSRPWSCCMVDTTPMKSIGTRQMPCTLLHGKGAVHRFFTEFSPGYRM
jgi:hypothetical protein